jgi:hypothetical protein
VSFSAVRAPGVGGGAPPKRPHAKAIATATNPAQALAQLAAKRARLDALPADRREAAEARDTWAKAEARMEGTKIRDDEGRLKKAAKRAEKEKVRSKKQWCVLVRRDRGWIGVDGAQGRAQGAARREYGREAEEAHGQHRDAT